MNTRDTFKGLGIGKTYAFTPRLPILQEWNGTTIKCQGAVDLDTLKAQIGLAPYESISMLFKLNGLDMLTCIALGKVGEKNLGKWLTHGHIPEAMVSKICAAKTLDSELILSTRYKDFVRMAKSKHWSSYTCALGMYSQTIQYYLHKPNTFILVNRGDDGDFRTRVIGRLTRITRFGDADCLKLPINQAIIIFNRTYGVPVKLPDMLNGIPCFTQEKKGTELAAKTLISDSLSNYEVGLEGERVIHRNENNYYDDLERGSVVILPTNPEAHANAKNLPGKPKVMPAQKPVITPLDRGARTAPSRQPPTVSSRAHPILNTTITDIFREIGV